MAEISGTGHGRPGRESGDGTGIDTGTGTGHEPRASATSAAHTTAPSPARPGGAGQWAVQEQLGTTEAAERFHAEQVLDHLNDRMREFASRQEMFFLSTSNRFGECHSTLRAGPRGFLRALDERTLLYPEYRGNGVHASLGNIAENPHAGLLLVDFERARIGLHVNGRAHLVPDAEVRELHPEIPPDPSPGRASQLWVRIDVISAHIHGAAHIPHLVTAPKRAPREWGTQDYRHKGGDFFGVARTRPAVAPSTKPRESWSAI
uniref:pyridoxamine 5'-phosphate oxidase family protein n=1 Tax=Streptomyces sp. SM12 TaxID=1071602 RepID=UPI000CD59953